MRTMDEKFYPVPFLILSSAIQAAVLGKLRYVLGISEENGRIFHGFWKAL